MNNFFDLTIERGSGVGFGRFSPCHFLWLGLGAAVMAALCIIYKKSGSAARRRLRLALAFTALGLELVRAALLAAAGRYGLGTLPLHLCIMAVYLCALHALRGGRLTGQFLYAFCVPGAVAALLFPDWVYYPAWHFMTLCSFALHILITAYVLMQITGGDIVPDVRSAPACLGIMLLIAVPVYVFDRLTGTNYLFLSYPSPGSPLEWFAFLGSPGHALGYLPILAAAWTAMYLPFRTRRPGAHD